MARVKEREIWELAAKEKREIVDSFDIGFTCSYVMRKTNLSRNRIKQVLCAAGRTGMFSERDNNVGDCTNSATAVKCRSDANRHLLDHSCSTSSLEASQGAPGRESGTVKTRDMYNLTPDDNQEILDLFDQGHSCSYIMRRTNVSSCYIEQLLGIAGRTFRERNRKRYDALRPVVLELFKQGWSLHAIKKHVKAKMFWVGKIIRDAGLMPRTRTPREKPTRVQPSPLKFTGLDKHVIVTIKKQDGVWRVSRGPKRREPRIGRHLDWTIAEDAHTDMPSSGNGMRSIISIALDDLQWKNICATTEDGKPSQEETASADHTQTVNQEAGIALEIISKHVSQDQVKKEEKIIESSVITPGTCAENTSGTALFHEENTTTGGRFQCQICSLSWDDEEPFLFHLADTVDEQFLATGIFLYCTGCKFKSRKPAKLGKHVIKYQSGAALQNCTLHAIKAVH
ncbi:uncharacterized protein LOC129592284 isoform X2 [Paramacrobiotus metropolitanus]|uniref:uncharacterized protein LOC129592284 isoform X2 n=1 Tax=Paramacrobiotus metropolitanus TaxID=2943436 RepID=UPI0024461D22|nr:uncharacterized protein LOC129592284 isoform X2 [Paramacrobiotus metropolitanus]